MQKQQGSCKGAGSNSSLPLKPVRSAGTKNLLLLLVAVGIILLLKIPARAESTAMQPRAYLPIIQKPEAPALPEWSFSIIDTTNRDYSTMTDRSLALDPQGMPHVVYGGNGLYYASFDGTNWDVVLVDSTSSVGKYASLAFSSNGIPHIAYYDDYLDNPKHAWWNGSSWQKETVSTTAGNQGTYTSIAVDSNDYPHIIYVDVTNRSVYYTYKMDTGWSNQIVVEKNLSTTGGYAYLSLALASDDTPHLTFYDTFIDTQNLKYAFRFGTGWTIQTVNSSGHKGMFSSLALDGNDRPHISYFDDDEDDLKVAYSASLGVWSYQTIDDPSLTEKDTTGFYTSIAVDSNNYAHISYYDLSNKNLKYARQTGSSTWEIVKVDTENNVGLYTSIALDADGLPYISYYDYTNTNLKLAIRNFIDQ